MNPLPKLKTSDHDATAPAPRRNIFPRMAATALGAVVLWSAGCASPVAVSLIDSHPSATTSPSKKVKLAVVVKDERPEKIKNHHICGTVRGDNAVPVTVAFVSQPQPLEVLAAAEVKRLLEQAGYEVVTTEPAVTETTAAKPLTRPPRSRGSEWSSAMFANAREGPIIPSTEGVLTRNVRPHRLSFAKPPPDFTPTIEVSIKKFNSDGIPRIVRAWCVIEVLGCYNSQGHKMKFWGKTLIANTFRAAGYSPAVNGVYWSAMHRLGDFFKSDEFANAVQSALRARGGDV